MTTLTQLIAPHLDKTAAEIVAMLNAPTVTVTDSERWHSDGVARAIGVAAFGMLDEVLKAAPGMDWVRIAMASDRGLDFSQPEMQDGIEALRPAIGSLADDLKSIGIRIESPWQADGNSGIVTAEQIAPVLADLITRRDAGAYWSRVLAAVNPLIDAGNTAAEIKAAAAGVE